MLGIHEHHLLEGLDGFPEIPLLVQPEAFVVEVFQFLFARVGELLMTGGVAPGAIVRLFLRELEGDVERLASQTGVLALQFRLLGFELLLSLGHQAQGVAVGRVDLEDRAESDEGAGGIALCEERLANGEVLLNQLTWATNVHDYILSGESCLHERRNHAEK